MTRSILPPPVVGNNKEEVGSCFTHIVAYILPENRFPAYDRGYPGAVLRRGKGLSELLETIAAHGSSKVYHQLFQETQELFMGHLLHPGDQHGFVVSGYLTGCIQL